MTTNVVETESTTAVVTENDLTSVVEVTSAGPAGPPGGALTIQDEGVDEGLLTDKINFAGSTVSVVNDTEAEIATVTVNAADPGANTNITSLGGITGGISSPDYVQFDTAAAAAGAVGRLLWNDTDGTLEFGLKGGNVTLQIGQEQVIHVTNKSGATISDGQAVYITGSTGNHLNVTLAQANAEATSSKTLAVVTETIANNNTGFATSSGLVRGLNTSALTEGAAIWLSPTVPGGLTSTKPVAPNHAVLIGWCVRQHASVGVIYVHIANGYELEELHNVLITAAANNQVLRYDAATNLWKNATISPTLTLTGDVSGSATFTDLGNATLTATVADDSHNHIISNVDGLQDALDSKLPAASYTAADVLTKIKTVDGTGSGLDADLLDGQDGAHYLDFTNATNKPDPTITLAGDATGSVTLTDLTSGTLNVTVVDDSHNHVIANVDGLQDALDSKLAAASYTATDVLDKIKTVDGAGSGLDADLLDGQSSAYYTAINDRLGYTAENAANKGIAGGYASLDGAGLVPATQLPSYVDDVLEFANLAAFPVTGETGKIYVAVDTSKTYRWSGSTYVEISASPGSTDAVPEGSTNLYFTTARARQSISASGSLSYDNVTGVVSYTTPNTDGIAEGTANLYHTTARARGAVSAGTGISYNSSTGVITNAAPDQTVAITGGGTTTVTGTYPNFTVSSADQYVGTVTSVSGTGTVNGLTLTGSVTSSGSLTLGGTLSVDLSTATVTGTLPVTKGGTGTATQFTAGSVVFAGTSGVYTQDNANLFWDDTNNRLGIGTTIPGYRLSVVGGDTTNALIAGDTKGVRFAFNSTTSRIEGVDGTGAASYQPLDINGSVVTMSTNGSERARLDASGNFGIGTSSPGAKFEVFGNNVRSVARASTTAGQVYLQAQASDYSSSFTGTALSQFGSTATGTTCGLSNASLGMLEFQNASAGLIYTNGGSPLVFGTVSQERMRIDNAGNLGLGTNSPTDRLHVRGTAQRFDKSNAVAVGQIRLLTTTDSYATAWALGQPPSSTNFAVQYFNGSAWSTAATVDTSGNLGLGVTPNTWGAGYRTIQLGPNANYVSVGQNMTFVNNGYNDGTGYKYQTTSGSAAYEVAQNIHRWYNAPSGTAGNAISFTQAMTLDGSGNLGVGTSAPQKKLSVSDGGNIGFEVSPNDAAQGYTRLINYNRATNAYTPVRYEGSTQTWYVGTAGTTRAMDITSTGDIGIGTSSPQGKLHVVTGTDNSLLFRGPINYATGGSIYAVNAANTAVAPMEFGASTHYFAGGNVGIGNSNPTTKLWVGSSGSGFGTATPDAISLGNTFANSAGDPAKMKLRLFDENGGNLYGFGVSSNLMEAHVPSGGAMAWYTGGSERARIDSSGNLLVGGTTVLGKISLQGDTNSNLDVWVRNDNAGSSSRAGLVLNAYGNNWRMGMGSSANNSNALTWDVDVGSTNVEVMRLTTSGNVGIGTNSPTAKLDVNADTVRVRTAKTPASATATGNAGDICWDADYVYVCVATNTWKRSALSTW